MIVHTTPGLLDIRAITTMGLSAKPVSGNPIGMFGTGLKYAIATLVRMGAKPVLWIGKDRYEFSTKKQTFRDKEYLGVMMRLQKEAWVRPRAIDLPFTTEYGKFWQPWMALRELHSNTLDEDGATIYMEEGSVLGTERYTKFVIDHPDYDKAYHDIDDIFLPNALRSREGPITETIQVLPDESKRIYYRGLRAMDTDKPCVATWNILKDMELTEDRTLKYDFYVKNVIAAYILGSDDYDLIHRVITAPKTAFEFELEFPGYITPSETFRKVMLDNPKGRSASSASYYMGHDRSAPEPPEVVWNKHPGPWLVDDRQVVDSTGAVVFDCPLGYKGHWSLIAQEIVTRVGKGVRVD